jgi:hypothetical protein
MGVYPAPQLFEPEFIEAVVSMMIATLKGGPGAPRITASEVVEIVTLGGPFSALEKKFMKFSGTFAVCFTVTVFAFAGEEQMIPRFDSVLEQPAVMVGAFVTVISL